MTLELPDPRRFEPGEVSPLMRAAEDFAAASFHMPKDKREALSDFLIQHLKEAASLIKQEPIKKHGRQKLMPWEKQRTISTISFDKMTLDEQERFSELDESDLWDLDYKYDAPIEDCYGPERFVLSAPLRGLVLLNWKRNDDPLGIEKVNLAERRDLLPAFMKSVGLFFLRQYN